MHDHFGAGADGPRRRSRKRRVAAFVSWASARAQAARASPVRPRRWSTSAARRVPLCIAVEPGRPAASGGVLPHGELVECGEPGCGAVPLGDRHARLSRTTGRVLHREQHVVPGDDRRPVGVRVASGASAWQAAIAAWTTYGSGRSGRARPAPRPSARRPRRIGPVATASGPGRRAAPTSRPASTRAARRESCSSISASSPVIDGSSGMQLVQQPAQPHGLVDQVAAHRVVPRPSPRSPR